jgi:hypothetical protein
LSAPQAAVASAQLRLLLQALPLLLLLLLGVLLPRCYVRHCWCWSWLLLLLLLLLLLVWLPPALAAGP